MDRTELLHRHANEEYDDYVKHYLVKYWQDMSQKADWESLVTANFASRHTVEGSLSEEKAIDVCSNRSGGGANNFTSTSLDKGFVERIVRYICEHVIAWHGQQIKGFANYQLPVKGQMYTVQAKANEGFLPRMYRDQVVVGIDGSGLINHFHGDAQYANPPIYVVDANKIHKA